MQIRDALGERMIKRDRLVVVSGLVGVMALSWACTVYLAWDMQHSEKALCCMSQLLMFTMWVIMMAAMMVPSAAPVILIFAAVNRRRREQERPFVPTGIFLLGYLVVWGGFSAVVTVLQWRLHETALLTPMMASASPLLSGATLMAAGIFQLTPLKHVCLQHCRSPLGFLLTNWRDDFRGVFRMGLQARDLLSGLLLAVDGSAVCGRRDESRMVGCVNRIHRPRKSRAGRNLAQSGDRPLTHRRESVGDRRGSALALR
jgi:predicted metal-binding membrane protein